MSLLQSNPLVQESECVVVSTETPAGYSAVTDIAHTYKWQDMNMAFEF